MRYHLTTLGSVLLLTAMVMLLAAFIGIVGGQAFEYGPAGTPGAGVTPTPTPVWSPPAPR